MARRDYGFVRSFASIGRDPTQLLNALQHGYRGVLFDYNDPYLAQAVQVARQSGVPFGLWGDPTGNYGANANAFAMRLAELSRQYNPEIVVPDIEFIGKGYQGSPGWDYNSRLAAALRQYLPNQRTAITVMPNQRDFNYEAYGPQMEWLPQAYGANPRTDVYDPRNIVQTLIERGVDPSMISPILGPGHQSGYGGSSLWTIDDFAPYGELPFQQASALETPRPDIGGSGARTTSSTRVVPEIVPARPRLSQSEEMVATGGLKWGGNTFSSKQDFSKWLQSRGKTYSDWAAKHPLAAAGLGRRSGVGGSSIRPV